MTLHALFALYLLLAGAGLRRTLQLAAAAIGLSVVFGAALMFTFPYLLSRPLEGYFGAVFGSTLLALPLVVFWGARDLVVPYNNLLQVVLVNVLALSFVEPFSVTRFLLNPVEPILPPVGAWLPWIVSLWPTWLAVALAHRGPPGDVRLRFLLNVWLEAVAFVWLLPTALDVIEGGFDATNLWTYAGSIVACICAVQVSLSALMFLVLADARDRFRHGQRLAQTIADRLSVTPSRPVFLLLAAGACWLVLDLTRGLVPDRATAASLAFLAVLGLGALANRRRSPVDADFPDESLAASAEPLSLWRFRFVFLLLALASPLLLALNYVRRENSFIAGPGTIGLVLVSAVWVALAACVLYGLLRFVWVIAESRARRPSVLTRRLAWWGGIAALCAWQWLIVPSPVPPGGLDGVEATLEGQRVYIWYAEEFGPLRRGRAVYLEDPDEGTRLRLSLCGASQYGPVQSFRIRPGGIIECRWSEHVAIVDKRGYNLLQRVGGLEGPLPVAPIAATQAPCAPAGDTPPVLRCGASTFVITEQSNGGFDRPIAWSLDDARQFVVPVPEGGVNCIELTVTASLDGAAPMPVPAVVLYNSRRLGEMGGIVWLYDRGASCGRLFPNSRGELWYEWSETTAALKRSTHFKVPVVGRSIL
jgi:hypothetical protein